MDTKAFKELVAPVGEAALRAELTPDKFIKHTSKAENEIYAVTASDSPMVMREIGRLRELSFRMAGAGTGKDCDVDRFDTDNPACHQLIVFDPAAGEIVGGYRFTYGDRLNYKPDGQPDNNMAKLFHFTDEFIRDVLPYSIEMARAFVQPKYQSPEMRLKSLYALDNLWEGIGALVAMSGARYLIGKVSVYSTMKPLVRDAILYFLDKSFMDPGRRLQSRHPHSYRPEDVEFFEQMFSSSSYKENYKALNIFVRENGESIPPLIHSYMGVSETMQTFGSCFDPSFGDVYDIAMIITMADVDKAKMDRYVNSYRK